MKKPDTDLSKYNLRVVKAIREHIRSLGHDIEQMSSMERNRLILEWIELHYDRFMLEQIQMEKAAKRKKKGGEESE